MSDDTEYNDMELMGLTVASMETARIQLDQAIIGTMSKNVRVRVDGVEYVGKLHGFDGKRLFVQHDMKVHSIIWLESGVVLTEGK